MERNKIPRNTSSPTNLNIPNKRDQYRGKIKNKAKKEAIQEKRNLLMQKDESILDKVRAKMLANFNTLSEEEKADPCNQLKGISQDEIEAALAVRARKLLVSFEVAVNEIPKIESIFRELILQCRDENHKYHKEQRN